MADELSPADEARLRRLLARSRHDERLPDDVASRLDDVLARLEAGDEALPGPRAFNTQLRELAARRRRTVATGLVAAAAVVVVGVGLGQVVDGRGSSAGDAATAEAEVSPEAAAGDRSEGRTDDDVVGGSTESDQVVPEEYAADSGAATLGGQELDGGSLADLLVVRGRLADVPEERFTRSAARLQRQVGPRVLLRSGRATQPLTRAPAPVQRAWQGCEPTEWGDGTALAVRYDGDPAVMVFRTPTGDAQVVEMLQCGTGEVLRSVTLPVG